MATEGDSRAIKPLPPELTPKLSDGEVVASRVVTLYREYGGNYDSLTSFCKNLGPINGFTRAWVLARRKKFPAFDEALKAVEADRAKNAGERSSATVLAQERWPNLQRWKGIWIERYRETTSRDEACKMVGQTWSQVETAMASDLGFAEAYADVNKDFLAAVEDAQLQMAISGKAGSVSAASGIIETQSDRFSKLKARQRAKQGGAGGSFTDYDVRETRERAKRLFQSCILPPAALIAQESERVEVPPGP